MKFKREITDSRRISSPIPWRCTLWRRNFTSHYVVSSFSLNYCATIHLGAFTDDTIVYMILSVTLRLIILDNATRGVLQPRLNQWVARLHCASAHISFHRWSHRSCEQSLLPRLHYTRDIDSNASALNAIEEFLFASKRCPYALEARPTWLGIST